MYVCVCVLGRERERERGRERERERGRENEKRTTNRKKGMIKQSDMAIKITNEVLRGQG